MKKDITSQEDVQLLVNSFYDKVNDDELLSPIFNDLKQVNWETHLPIMYRFWGSILLGEASYNGQPFPKHRDLPVNQNHFDRWKQLFAATVDEFFERERANEAKMRAETIAGIFWGKIKTLNQG